MRDSILKYKNKKGDTLIVAIMYRQGKASYTMTVNDELKDTTANEEDVKDYISNFLKNQVD